MPPIREADIVAYLTEHPTSTVQDLQGAFPDADTWMLRTQRREFQQDGLLEDVKLELADLQDVRALSPTGQVAMRAGFFRPTKVVIPAVPYLKPVFKKAGQEFLIISDIHAPDHDPHALDVALQIGQSLHLDELIIAGDGMDVHALSRYTPAANRPYRWADERAAAVPVFGMIRQMFPKIPITYLIGNHDVRPMKFLAQQAAALQNSITLPHLLGLDDLSFIFPEENRVVIGGKLLVIHGTRVRSEAGVSVQQEVRESGMSTVMGHVHRRALYDITRTAQRVAGEQNLFGVELGCVCNLRPDYLEVERTANWQHGALVVTVFDNGLIYPEPIRIDNGHAFFRGKMVSSRIVA